MVESIVGIYGLICWLVFVKYKLVPVTTYTVCTAILIGVLILAFLAISVSIFHPVGHDGRMYAPVVQIVPQVRGTVIEVPVVANQPLKMGDVLFRIDPVPYRIEVERLQALLVARNRDVALDVEALAAAEAATTQARANLLVSESTQDRQLKESYERAKSQVLQVKARLDLAVERFGRAEQLQKQGAGSQEDYDRAKAQKLSLEQEFGQVQKDEAIAAEQLKSGTASLDKARAAVVEAEKKEAAARKQVEVRIVGDGKNPPVTPEVREIMAQLEKARWELDQTVVRAPSSGYVPQVLLRPGMMAVPFPVKPLMMFVVEERPTLVATFPQRVISDIKPGLKGEAVFKQYPGRSFKVKVRRVLTAIREGELDATGNIAVATSEHAPGYIPIVFDYDEDISGLNLPIGAQASIAVYTDRAHALSILRKIILRIHSWENYIF